MTTPNFLETEDGRRIAYCASSASGRGQAFPGLVFLGGYASDMSGTKARFLEARARARGQAFLRLDYTGHGASSGAFADGCVGDWARDAWDALSRLTEGPQILIGSSMGGWIACLLARRAPARMAGLIGIAAAPDFTTELLAPELTEPEKTALTRDGLIRRDNPYGPEPTIYTNRLMRDGAAQCVLTQPLPAPFPVRLLHGDADRDVPVWLGLKLLAHLDCADARISVVKGADHRFSGPEELALIDAAAVELSERAQA